MMYLPYQVRIQANPRPYDCVWGAGEGMDWVFNFVEKYQQMSSSHDILDIRRDGGNLKAKIQIAKVQNV